jgi:hypothetical protein
VKALRWVAAAACLAAGAAAAEEFTPPQFSFAGSIGASRTTNVLFSAAPPYFYDNYVSPTVGLFANGALTDGWSYRLGAEYFTERYADFPGTNFSTVRLGGSVARTFDGLILRAGYYAWLNYSDDFDTRYPASHDIFLLLTRPFPLAHGWSLTPIVGFTRRWITDGLAGFYRVNASVILGIPIEKWTLQLRPGAIYDIYDELAGVKRRDFSPSFTTSLSYPLNDHFTFTLTAAFAMRDSNLPFRDYKKLDVGPGLDVSYRF